MIFMPFRKIKRKRQGTFVGTSQQIGNRASLTFIIYGLLLNLGNCQYYQTSFGSQSFSDSNEITGRILQTGRKLLFLEQYHFPITPEMCEDYTEAKMLAFKDDFTINPYFERYWVWQAIKEVIGADTEISFKCIESFEQDSADDLANVFAGKFGNNEIYSLESDSYWMSIPTLHHQYLYLQRKIIFKQPTQNIFAFLNYLFYLAIFLTPIATGIILLLLKDLKSFYDYQGVVFSVFRYLNRQGDQQMILWMNKILSYIVAMFFFFHYAILLSEMTALRALSDRTSQYNRDSYRAIINSQVDIPSEGAIYYFICADTYQYHFLKNEYTTNNVIQDNIINHYNLLLSKFYFSQDEYEAILIILLQLSFEHFSKLSLKVNDQQSVSNHDIFVNWSIVAVTLGFAIIFKLFQTKFSSINQYTEIKSFRDGRNQQIIHHFKDKFNIIYMNSLMKVLLLDGTSNFSKISIPQKTVFMGKQIFKIIEKRRKKIQKHRRKKQQHEAQNSIEKTKQSLYGAIKGFIELSQKKSNLGNQPLKTYERRLGVQQLKGNIESKNQFNIRIFEIENNSPTQVKIQLTENNENENTIIEESVARKRFQSQNQSRQFLLSQSLTPSQFKEEMNKFNDNKFPKSSFVKQEKTTLKILQNLSQIKQPEQTDKQKIEKQQADNQLNFIENKNVNLIELNHKKSTSEHDLISKLMNQKLQFSQINLGQSLESNNSIEEGTKGNLITKYKQPNQHTTFFQNTLNQDEPDYKEEEFTNSNEQKEDTTNNQNENLKNSNIQGHFSRQTSFPPYGFLSTPENKNTFISTEENQLQDVNKTRNQQVIDSETSQFIKPPTKLFHNSKLNFRK